MSDPSRRHVNRCHFIHKNGTTGKMRAVGGPVSKIYIRMSEKRHGHSERIRQSEELHVEKHGDI